MQIISYITNFKHFQKGKETIAAMAPVTTAVPLLYTIIISVVIALPNPNAPRPAPGGVVSSSYRMSHHTERSSIMFYEDFWFIAVVCSITMLSLIMIVGVILKSSSKAIKTRV